MIHSSRILFLFVLLLISFFGQAMQTQFDLRDVFRPIYVVLSLSFGLQILFLSFFDKMKESSQVAFLMFIAEALFISLLIYFFGPQRSLFVFLFLLNILFCGILFGTAKAFIAAIVSSLAYSLALALDESVGVVTFFSAISLSQIAFFTVAYFSGFFREQLEELGVELSEKVQNLRNLENLNDLILENMNGGLLTTELNGEIIRTNSKAKSFFAEQGSELQGNNIVSVFPGLNFHDSEDSDGKSFTYNFEKNDETHFLRMHLSKIQDEEASRGYILNFHDETPLYTLEKRVRQSEKLAAVGQLAAGIAHEIRNPLASMSGSIQLLRADLANEQEKKKLMGIIDREILRLNGLITEFLDYARPEAPKNDDVDLGTLLDQIMEMMKFQFAEQEISQSREIDAGIRIRGNKDKLKQAFLNIVVNAYQAMDKSTGGVVSVHVARSGACAEVSISDNGSGIEEKTLSRIFEPFLTTKHKGTGLGLAITHSIFESHGANVEVKSKVGEGTQFIIRFPEKALL